MTIYHGKEGVVKAGANAVGELENFSVTVTAPLTTRRSMGKEWADTLAGIKEWAGTLTMKLDPADTGQQALNAGAAVALELFPQGETGTGKLKMSGNAVLGEDGTETPVDDAIMFNVSFTGDGALTKETLV